MEKKNSKKGGKVRTYLLCIAFGLVLIYVAALVIFSVYVFGRIMFSGGEEDIVKTEEKEVFDYQSLQIDAKTKQISFGMIRTFRKLGPEEFFFSSNENGMSLISNYGAEEYKCTGSCYCEETDSNRRVGAAISRSLTYLVAATTTLVAVGIAKEYFKDACVTELEDTCPLNSIRSEVDDCNFVLVDDKEDSNSMEGTGGEGENTYEFMCKGTCRFQEANYDILAKHFMDLKRVKDLQNRDYIQGKVDFLNDQRSRCEHLQIGKRYTKTGTNVVVAANKARKDFMDNTFGPFCLAESVISASDFSTYLSDCPWSGTHYCQAQGTSYDFIALKCRKIGKVSPK